MEIDYALILCAGLGTRMGPIGKVLPKPLWPIFEKTLLELQVSFAKSLGVQRIFVNVHHQSELFKDIQDVELIFEPEILGTGGAVHNVAQKLNYQGSFLYMASDQFYFFEDHFLKAGLDLLQSHGSVLFGFETGENSSYAQLEIKAGLLKSILGPREVSGTTFSGLALVNLSKLKKDAGYSSFFESVCRYKFEDIPVVTPCGDYIDWGTATNYFTGMFDLLRGRPSAFYEFCQHLGVFDSEKINLKENSYGSDFKNIINMTPEKIFNTGNNKAIVLKEGIGTIEKNGLYFDNIIHELPF